MLESDLALQLFSYDREVVWHADEMYQIENGVALRQRSMLSREQP
jgi:hypothetical protein